MVEICRSQLRLAQRGHATPRRRWAIDDRGRRAVSVLLLVLVVVAVLSLCVATSLETTGVDYRAAVQAGRRLQAQRLAESRAEFLKAYLAQPDGDLLLDGGLVDNPARFRGAIAIDDPVDAARGRFSIYSPVLVDGVTTGMRFGLEDESTRLHWNALAADPHAGVARRRLMVLPGMTDEIADALLDGIDSDDEVRRSGAERDFYEGLAPPILRETALFRVLTSSSWCAA